MCNQTVFFDSFIKNAKKKNKQSFLKLAALSQQQLAVEKYGLLLPDTVAERIAHFVFEEYTKAGKLDSLYKLK